MTELVVRHEIIDFRKWYQGYEKAEPIRGQYGVTAVSALRDVDDPNVVLVSHTFPNADKARAYLADKNMQSAMHASGVIGLSRFEMYEEV